MATVKQIQANRLNAQKCHGPTSDRGKARSALNALKSGIHAEAEILPWEDPAERAALAAEYHADHQPQTAEERSLVDNLVHYEFLSRRFRKMEVNIVTSKIPEGADPHNPAVAGKAWCDASAELGRLQRRMDANNRNFHRDLDQLRLLEAQSPGPVPETVAEAPSPAVTSEEIGFVSRNLNNPNRPQVTYGVYHPKNPNHPEPRYCPRCSKLGYILINCDFRLEEPASDAS